MKIKKIVSAIIIGFSIFNILIFFLSLGVWHLAWIGMSVSTLTGVTIFNAPSLINEPLSFKLFVCGFTLLTVINLFCIYLHDAFNKIFLVECLNQDLQLKRCTKDEYKKERKLLWKRFLLGKLT